MSGGRSSAGSPHVFRGGFKLPKHLKSPLHAPEGEDQSAFGIGHDSPLLHKSLSMTGLYQGPNEGDVPPHSFRQRVIVRSFGVDESM